MTVVTREANVWTNLM